MLRGDEQAWYVQPTTTGSSQAEPQLHRGSISYVDFDAKGKASKEKRQKSSKHKKEKKRSRKEKHSRRDSDRDGVGRSASGVAKKSVQQLREERMAREAVERRRALQAQVGRLQA